LAAWPLYLFLAPAVWLWWGPWALLLAVFPGAYLMAWVGFCQHECWHHYMPSIPQDRLFTVYGRMLLTDPQVFRLLHGHHHSEVNTFNDREFHPLGEIHNLWVRRAYHLLEISLGLVFLLFLAGLVIPGLPGYREKYRRSGLWISALAWVVFFGGLGWLAHACFGVTAGSIALSYAATVWAGSVLVHLDQLVEHGNLIVAGDWNQRNLATRNLRRLTLLEKALLFMMHNDSREHVLHHTQVRVFSRPFPGRLPFPDDAVVLSAGQLLGVLRDMLLGRPSPR
jgi:fatty acid desaturase